jgi:hypothetical protein
MTKPNTARDIVIVFTGKVLSRRSRTRLISDQGSSEFRLRRPSGVTISLNGFLSNIAAANKDDIRDRSVRRLNVSIFTAMILNVTDGHETAPPRLRHGNTELP